MINVFKLSERDIMNATQESNKDYLERRYCLTEQDINSLQNIIDKNMLVKANSEPR